MVPIRLFKNRVVNKFVETVIAKRVATFENQINASDVADFAPKGVLKRTPCIVSVY